MNPDLAFVIGFVLAVFAIPSAVSAIIDGRAPRMSTVTIIVGGAFMAYAFGTQPGGYKIHDIPDIFVRVIARYIS